MIRSTSRRQLLFFALFASSRSPFFVLRVSRIPRPQIVTQNTFGGEKPDIAARPVMIRAR
jgi:hypothetical protein